MDSNNNDLVKLHSKHRRQVHTMARHHYEMLKAFILDTLETNGHIRVQHLIDLANTKLFDAFGGDLAWQLLQTKNDLEARGLITITRGEKCDQLIALKIAVATTMSLAGTKIRRGTDLAGRPNAFF